MEAIQLQDMVLALRPLLANTPISKNQGKNWDQILQTSFGKSDFVETWLADLGERIQWVSCPDCGKEFNNLTMTDRCIDCVFDDQKKENQDRVNGEYLNRSIGAYGIEKYSFGSFKVSEENKDAFEACKRFDPLRHNLYISGACGIGKTHLAGALLKEMSSRNLSIKWANSLYISRHIKGRYPADEEQFIDVLSYVDVLVLDDLGTGRDADALLRLIYELAEKRRARNKFGWVITSNHNLDDLAKRFGDDRIASRLSGFFKFVEIKGFSDYRLKARFWQDEE